MTTTEASLDRVEEIVDEYLRFDLDGIFLRPLSPYGFAVKTKAIRKYDSKGWLDFYARGLRYILEINRRGRHFPGVLCDIDFKAHALRIDLLATLICVVLPALVLGRWSIITTERCLRRTKVGCLRRWGIKTFELGSVTDSYRSLVFSDKLFDLVGSSLTQCAPECLDCVYEAHCGADPVYHHATQADAVGIKPLSEFCARQKGVMSLLLEILESSPQDAAILRRWGGM